MKEELRRTSEWEAVSSSLDPGSLLSLIQTTCLNGNDKDYYPNRFISGLMDVVSNRQGSDSPSEFAERTKTLVNTFNVFGKLEVGSTFAGSFPRMREHTITILPASSTSTPRTMSPKLFKSNIKCNKYVRIS